MNLYTSQTACAVCEISPRKLDYWVATGVFRPSHTYSGRNRRRLFFLFSFDDIVRLKTIRELREAGLPLSRIRSAVETLNKRFASWRSGWLVTDGRSAFLRHDGARIEALTGKHSGQLAFAAVALRGVATHVRKKLLRATPFDWSRLHGEVEPYRRSG